MSRKTPKTDFEKLQKEWYAKLEATGFHDIENGDISELKIPRSYHWENELQRQSVQDYYCMAYHFLNEHQFDTELDKIIWEYHAEGLSIRNIVRLLNETKVTKTNRERVWQLVRKLENIMKGLYLSV